MSPEPNKAVYPVSQPGPTPDDDPLLAVIDAAKNVDRQPPKMSDCTSPLGTVCKDPACPLHFPADQPDESESTTADRSQFGPELPLSLTAGLTVWGDYGGAQIRVESDLCTCEQPDLHVAAGSATGVLYIHHRDNAPRSTEEGQPWRLTGDDARALRDLLNVATARGFL